MNLFKWIRNTFTVVVFLMACNLQGQTFYYHTIRSKAVMASVGRTLKLQYTKQQTHHLQLRISTNYIDDRYTISDNKIRSTIGNLNVHLQYNLVHFNRLFVNGSMGAGGYYLKAEDQIGITIKEGFVNLSAGLQLELYISRNKMALVADIDILYMPRSEVYTFLRSPSIGFAFYF